MSTRKKNADLPRQGKPKNNDKQQQQQRPTGSEGKPTQPSPPVRGLDLAAMLMIGDEHVVINGHEDDNISFMAEFIDP
ncbi:MAG TPA: hypothetical protein VN089_16725 [Duganella sp.]|nr:hypothetical protein [Duganella sp.]